jgi:hypothetical protein
VELIMFERLFLAALVAVPGLAAPVMAGDQPVITTGWPSVVKYYESGQPVDYLFDGPVIMMRSETTAVRAPAAGETAAGLSGNSVAATSLSRSDTAALYSRLMAEARDRGLK